MLGLPSWPHFPHSSRPGHIQVSALGQLLGQNGNIASMVSERQTACSVSQLASWQPEYFLLLGISSLSSAQLDKYQKLREREEVPDLEHIHNQNLHFRARSGRSSPGTTPPLLTTPHLLATKRTTRTTRTTATTMTSLTDFLETRRD